MRIHDHALIPAVLLGAAATPAAAQEAKPGPLAIHGSATLVTDYRFRGISQTDQRPALQGSLTVEHRSGLYASVWGSSIDDYVANGADQELDLIAGVRHGIGATTLDAGLLYYHYPGSDGVASDFVEPYVSITRAVGPASFKGSIAYAPRQNALSVGRGREDNLYLAGDVTLAVPASPVSLTGHLGHGEGPSFITIGRSYTDWSLGASAAWRGLILGVAYVDTDAVAFSPRGRQIARAGIVASLGASF